MPSKSYALSRRSSSKFPSKFGGRPGRLAAKPKRVPAVSSIDKRNSNFTRQLGAPSNNGGFPLKKNVTLRYCQEFSVVGGAAVITNYIFRLNSIFDPDYAVGGHQPLGHDQWAAIYETYRVNRAKITILPVSDAAGHTTPALLTLGVRDRVTTLPTINSTDLFESSSYTSPIVIGPLGHDAYLRKLVQEVDIGKFTGVKDMSADTTLNATFGANPVEAVYGHVAVCPINGNTPGTHKFLATIEYDCTFTDPKNLTQS